MAGILIAVGALMAVLAAAAKAHADGGEAAPAHGASSAASSPALKKIIASRNPKAIAAAALALHHDGQTELAKSVAKTARAAQVLHPGATYKSPFPGVAAGAWSRFVHALKGHDPAAITPSYSLGLFGFGMRRLVDLGLATNPHRIDRNGRKVWDADWKSEYDPGPDTFLHDPDLQYKTLGRSMLAYGKQVARELPGVVGSLLDGVPVTLSGLLAVAHLAGFEGLKQWASAPEIRAKFPSTTQQFRRLNGIF